MDTVEEEILGFAKRWADAIVSNDAPEIARFMADDWVIIGENGAIGKQDFLSWVASGDVTHEMMEMIGDARIKIYGDTIILTARVINSGHYKNQPFSADEWTTDVFRQTENGWQCVLSHITPAKDQ